MAVSFLVIIEGPQSWNRYFGFRRKRVHHLTWLEYYTNEPESEGADKGFSISAALLTDANARKRLTRTVPIEREPELCKTLSVEFLPESRETRACVAAGYVKPDGLLPGSRKMASYMNSLSLARVNLSITASIFVTQELAGRNMCCAEDDKLLIWRFQLPRQGRYLFFITGTLVLELKHDTNMIQESGTSNAVLLMAVKETRTRHRHAGNVVEAFRQRLSVWKTPLQQMFLCWTQGGSVSRQAKMDQCGVTENDILLACPISSIHRYTGELNCIFDYFALLLSSDLGLPVLMREASAYAEECVFSLFQMFLTLFTVMRNVTGVLSGVQPTYYSKLDAATRKVVEFQIKPVARNIDNKGLKFKLFARLQAFLDEEKKARAPEKSKIAKNTKAQELSAKKHSAKEK
ncbi:P30 dbc protein [Clonorchis sinensis]|uniref:p30 dbc protein n=1 Tax=Clonorchis sinensis TaxID=79923 RepID=G7Y312_CLOSI|nr:P30 dbc protein [Clonorchis sinensis]